MTKNEANLILDDVRNGIYHSDKAVTMALIVTGDISRKIKE